MTKLIAIAALLGMIYASMMIWHAVTRKPFTISHGEQLARQQAIATVGLVLAALVFGLSLDNLL